MNYGGERLSKMDALQMNALPSNMLPGAFVQGFPTAASPTIPLNAPMLQQQQEILKANNLLRQQALIRELLITETTNKLLGVNSSLMPQLQGSGLFLPPMNAATMMLINNANANNQLLAAASLNAALMLNQANANTPAVPSSNAPKLENKKQERRGSRSEKPAKRHRPQKEDDDDDSSSETASGRSEGGRKREHGDPELMHGERRLTIQFDSFGTRGVCPQTFGRGSCVIPDGLTGRHTLYGESWRFSVKHETYDVETGLACITWAMTSLASNKTLARTETLAEARKREMHGRTIANQVVKKALEMRALELESRLASEANDTWRLHLKGKIDALRPARFTQGPLAFGLHHRAVQDRMKELLNNPEGEKAAQPRAETSSSSERSSSSSDESSVPSSTT